MQMVFSGKIASAVSQGWASPVGRKKNLAKGPGAGNVGTTKIERAPACSNLSFARRHRQ
jgi:hypothetical protein